jgi:hypothetical protein
VPTPDEFILPDGARELTRFDVTRFRRHHNKTVRELHRQHRRRRELEAECEQLRTLLVEVVVRWYDSGGQDRLPGMLGGSGASSPLIANIKAAIAVRADEDNANHG